MNRTETIALDWGRIEVHPHGGESLDRALVRATLLWTLCPQAIVVVTHNGRRYRVDYPEEEGRGSDGGPGPEAA